MADPKTPDKPAEMSFEEAVRLPVRSNEISFEDALALPKTQEEPGFLSTAFEAVKEGLGAGVKETIQGLPGQEWQYTPQTKEPTHLEKLLAEPISLKAVTDPKWLASNMLYGMAKSSPTIGGTIVGGGLGATLTANPIGMVGGAVLGGGLTAYIQTLAPAYQKARSKGLSHEEAVDDAMQESFLAGGFGGASAAAPFLKVMKGPVSQALAQIFGIQPGLAVAQEVATKGTIGEEINAEDLLKTGFLATGTGALQTVAGKGTEAIGRRVRPETPPTPPPTKPDSPEVAAGKEMGLIYAKAEKDMNPNDLVFLDYAKRGGYGEAIQKEALAFLDEQKQKVFDAAQRIEGEIGDTATPGRTADVSAIPRDELMGVARRIQDDVRQAQEAATAAEQRLREAPERLAETIGEDIRGGAPRVESRIEAGEVLGPAIKEAYDVRKSAEQEAYKRAADLGGGYYIDAIRNIGTRIREGLTTSTLEKPGMLLTEEQAPLASQALKYLDELGQLQMKNIADPRNIVTGDGDAKPVLFNLSGINSARVVLNDLYGKALSKANRGERGTDLYAMQEIRRNFEQYLDDAFVNGMFSGNPEAIAAWTEARGMVHDRKKLFQKSAQHPQGKIIDDIVKQKPDPQAVANMLFGVSRMGSKTDSAVLARRLGLILGPDSKAMSAIRQAAWSDVTSGARVRARNGDVDPRLVARDVLEFAGKDDRNSTDLARELYTPELRQRMREYANSIRGLDDAIARAPEVVRAGEIQTRAEAALSPDIGGRAGTVFRRLVDGTAQPEEVANLVATHYAHAPSPNLARMIAHIKTLTGNNSESMSAIRQLLFKRLVLNADESGTKSPVEMSKAIREFLDGKGSSVARAAMRPSDMMEIRKFEKGIQPYILPEVAKTGSPTEIRQSGRRFQEGDIEAKRRVESVARALGRVGLAKVPGMIREPLVTTIGKMAGEQKRKSSMAKLETEYMQKLREQIEDGFAKAEAEPKPVVGPRAALATEKEEDEPRRATGGSVLAKMANGGAVEKTEVKKKEKAPTWTSTNRVWNALNPYQKAAAMALMEADAANPADARNALGAMVNRAARSRQDLGTHVSQRIYQPTIEPKQEARLPQILKSPAFQQLTGWAERRSQGYEPDPVNGATHFLAPESVMLKKYEENPDKYHDWGPFKNTAGRPGINWSKYNPDTKQYENVTLRDRSHVFTSPEGRFSVPYRGTTDGAPPTTTTDQEALNKLIADAEKREGMDRLVSDVNRPQNVQSLASDQEARQGLDKAVESAAGPSSAQKDQLSKYIQGLMAPQPQAPMPMLQGPPIQATPIAPVTPYDTPRAEGGSVLDRFKKKDEDDWRSNIDIPGPQDPRRQDEVRASEAPRYEEVLPGRTVSALNQNPIFQAIQRFAGRSGADPSQYYISPIDGSVQPVEQKPSLLDRFSPIVREGVDKAMLAANFLGPAVKLPPTPKPTGIRAYHGSPHDFSAERLIRTPEGKTEYITGAPDKLPEVPKGAEVIEDFPLGRFRDDKIGSGEGAQAYGHGHYSAEAEGVAKGYRDALAQTLNVSGAASPLEKRAAQVALTFSNNTPEGAIEWLSKFRDKGAGHTSPALTPELVESVINKFEKGEFKPGGRMYELNIKAAPDQFLDWDKPLSEQSEAVRAALNPAEMGLKPKTVVTKNGETYSGWVDDAGAVVGMFAKGDKPPAQIFPYNPNISVQNLVKTYLAEEHTRHLAKAGIPGIRYKDASSRGREGGTYNYVVFDPKLIEIVRKYGIAGVMMGGGVMFTQDELQAAGILPGQQP